MKITWNMHLHVLEYASILNTFLHARRQEPESRARQSIIWQQDIWTGIRKNCMFLKMHCMRSGQQNWQDIIRLACMTEESKEDQEMIREEADIYMESFKEADIFFK